jgi:hypothetical protein
MRGLLAGTAATVCASDQAGTMPDAAKTSRMREKAKHMGLTISSVVITRKVETCDQVKDRVGK